MMALSPEQWNQELSVINYDHAWSLVQFLAHAEDGRFQHAFDDFLKALSQGVAPADAWQKQFGDVAKMEAKWRDYWIDLPRSPTAGLYARSALTTVTSFLARAESNGELFANFDEFDREATGGRLGISESDWLPPALLDDAMGALRDIHAELSLEREHGNASVLRCKFPDGTRAVARYSRGLGRQVVVTVGADE